MNAINVLATTLEALSLTSNRTYLAALLAFAFVLSIATVGCQRDPSSEVSSRAQEEALFKACSAGNANEVLRLLDQGVSTDVREEERETP